MKLLYLNFADPTDAATGNTLPVLAAKYQRLDRSSRWNRFVSYWWGPSVVQRVDVFPAMAEVRRFLRVPLGQNAGTTPHFTRIKREVDAFFGTHADCDKVMVGMHGMYDDVTHGYALADRNAPTMSYLEIYDMLLMLLEDRFRRTLLRMSLVMCYGARSHQYRLSHEHAVLGTVTGPDLSTSFAYRLFSLLCKQMKLKLSARTGAASFNNLTGRSQVESEQMVLMRIQVDQNKPSNTEKARFERMMEQSEAVQTFLMRVMTGDQEETDFDYTRLERDDARVLQNVAREQAFTLRKNDPAGKPAKYGKILYEHDEQTHKVVVTSKYPSAKVVLRKSV